MRLPLAECFEHVRGRDGNRVVFRSKRLALLMKELLQRGIAITCTIFINHHLEYKQLGNGDVNQVSQRSIAVDQRNLRVN